MKKSKNVLESGNTAVEWTIDNAVRTFYPWEGCWKIQESRRGDMAYGLILELWEWATDKKVPEGFHLENRCRTEFCVNPDCMSLYKDDDEEDAEV